MAKGLDGFLARACSLYESGEYGDAVRHLDEARAAGCDCADVLVIKARALQLWDEPGPIGEIAECLDEALQLEPGNVFALLEYGWFLYSVMDRPVEAEVRFRQALKVLREKNTEAAIGIAKCQAESASKPRTNGESTITLSDLLDSARVREALIE